MGLVVALTAVGEGQAIHLLYAFRSDLIDPKAAVLHGTHGNKTYASEHFATSYIPDRIHWQDLQFCCSWYNSCKSNVEDLLANMCTLCTCQNPHRKAVPNYSPGTMRLSKSSDPT